MGGSIECGDAPSLGIFNRRSNDMPTSINLSHLGEFRGTLEHIANFIGSIERINWISHVNLAVCIIYIIGE